MQNEAPEVVSFYEHQTKDIIAAIVQLDTNDMVD